MLNPSGIIATGGGTPGVDISIELGRSGTHVNINTDADVLALIGKSAGQQVKIPNDFWGLSRSTNISFTFSTVANYTLNVSSISGYVTGAQNSIDIIVPAGVYVYSMNTGTPALTITGGSALDIITLTVNGYIQGAGGNGGFAYDDTSGNMQIGQPGVGGPALSLGQALTIIGGGYIGGGGGGGAGINGFASVFGSGGGGAGGGGGGSLGLYGCTACGNNYPDNFFPGGQGSGPGGIGSNGNGNRDGTGSGGGGGGQMPGTGGVSSNSTGFGGGAGGGGGSNSYIQYSGAGGSAGNPGGHPSFVSGNQISSSGGGGGWGAAGGASGSYNGGNFQTFPGAAGGKAIQLNGYGVSHSGVTVYGAVA